MAPKYDAVLLGDGVLAVAGWFIKLIHPATPVCCIVHGLDVTYSNPIYQHFWIGKFLPKLDKIIAVSRATAKEINKRCRLISEPDIIPNGINRVAKNVSRKRKELEALLDISLQGKIVLLTVGRLVKRKGVYWFVDNVMPDLDEKYIFIIAGDGPERNSITKCIENKNLNRKVFCLGFVTEQIKTSLFSNSDLFVQPNIKVEGDMEGFGISVLEANLHGLAVLGSKLEGLEDSIVHGKNGWQVPPGDTGAYVSAINQKAEDTPALSIIGEKAREYCLNHFCWDEIAERYLRSIAAAGKSKHPHR